MPQEKCIIVYYGRGSEQDEAAEATSKAMMAHSIFNVQHTPANYESNT